jgi:hypothetical protein
LQLVQPAHNDNVINQSHGILYSSASFLVISYS